MTPLQDIREALKHLRASSGYKTAKRANPRTFPKTELGLCEQKLEQAAAKLGSKVSLLL